MSTPSHPLHEVAFAKILNQPLDSILMRRLVDNSHAGAVVGFEGVVRDHDPQASGEVTFLDYTAHPDAEQVLLQLCHQVLADYPDVRASVAVSQRVGNVSVGEVAVVCWVATAHRQAAFALCQNLIDAIKTQLPVWKKQHQADGNSTWSGLQ